MSPWRFFEAMDATDSFLTLDIAKLPKPSDVKAQLDVVLPKIAQLPQLKPPHAKVLKGKCKDLIELRFEYQNVAYRPLGYYMTAQRRTFVIVMLAREKNWDWVPKDACKIARSRKRLVDANPTRVREYRSGLHGVLAPKRDR
jgi:hypothetical protein